MVPGTTSLLLRIRCIPVPGPAGKAAGNAIFLVMVNPSNFPIGSKYLLPAFVDTCKMRTALSLEASMPY